MNNQLHYTPFAGGLNRDMIMSSQDPKTEMYLPNIVRIDSVCTTSSDLTSYSTNWSRTNSLNRVPLLRRRDSSYGLIASDSSVKFSQDVLVLEFEKNKSTASLIPQSQCSSTKRGSDASFLSGSMTKRSSSNKNTFTQDNQLDKNGMKIVDICHYHEWSSNDRHEKNSRWCLVSEDDDRHLKMNNNKNKFSLSIPTSGLVKRKAYRNFNENNEDDVKSKSSCSESSVKTAPAMLGRSENIFQEILDDFVFDLKIANMR